MRSGLCITFIFYERSKKNVIHKSILKTSAGVGINPDRKIDPVGKNQKGRIPEAGKAECQNSRLERIRHTGIYKWQLQFFRKRGGMQWLISHK